MDWFARFPEELKSEEHDVHFKKDNGSDKTRCYVAGESEDKYYIVKKPNNIEDNRCFSFNKKDEGIVFNITQE